MAPPSHRKGDSNANSDVCAAALRGGRGRAPQPRGGVGEGGHGQGTCPRSGSRPSRWLCRLPFSSACRVPLRLRRGCAVGLPLSPRGARGRPLGARALPSPDPWAHMCSASPRSSHAAGVEEPGGGGGGVPAPRGLRAPCRRPPAPETPPPPPAGLSRTVLMCGPLIKEETHRVSGAGGYCSRGGCPQSGGVRPRGPALQERRGSSRRLQVRPVFFAETARPGRAPGHGAAAGRDPGQLPVHQLPLPPGALPPAARPAAGALPALPAPARLRPARLLPRPAGGQPRGSCPRGRARLSGEPGPALPGA